MTSGHDERLIADVRATLGAAVERLTAAGARDEALAQYIPPRRVLVFFTRDAVLAPLGRVWRLGALLLDRDAHLYATGELTRAVAPGRPAYQSASAETRRAHRAAAFRGPFEPGETVNFGTHPIELDAAALSTSTGPLIVRDGTVKVLWSPTASPENAVDLADYLADRVGLLEHPPDGA